MDLAHKRLDVGSGESGARELSVIPDIAEMDVFEKRTAFGGRASALGTQCTCHRQSPENQ
jgi:hypothetical protein